MANVGENSVHSAPAFSSHLSRHGLATLARRKIRTLQVNVGKLCNQACHHCHVEAGPKRTEIMPAEVAERVCTLIDRSPGIVTVDITGGAPELVPCFRHLVERSRAAGKSVIDRCNLTVLFEEGMDWLPRFLVDSNVDLICSLPCYTAANVDQQRGSGVFEKSIAGLRLLNKLGYAAADSSLRLDLVYNPLGAFLPPPQAELEAKYRRELRTAFGIEFNRLLTITNMPIKRFADQLHRQGDYQKYLGLLVDHFDPANVENLMCRDMVSVGWNGTLYDCDFNQMLAIPAVTDSGPTTVDDVESFDSLAPATIQTGFHCFGCTAGNGSSCGGALRR